MTGGDYQQILVLATSREHAEAFIEEKAVAIQRTPDGIVDDTMKRLYRPCFGNVEEFLDTPFNTDCVFAPDLETQSPLVKEALGKGFQVWKPGDFMWNSAQSSGPMLDLEAYAIRHGL